MGYILQITTHCLWVLIPIVTYHRAPLSDGNSDPHHTKRQSGLWCNLKKLKKYLTLLQPHPSQTPFSFLQYTSCIVLLQGSGTFFCCCLYHWVINGTCIDTVPCSRASCRPVPGDALRDRRSLADAFFGGEVRSPGVSSLTLWLGHQIMLSMVMHRDFAPANWMFQTHGWWMAWAMSPPSKLPSELSDMSSNEQKNKCAS